MVLPDVTLASVPELAACGVAGAGNVFVLFRAAMPCLVSLFSAIPDQFGPVRTSSDQIGSDRPELWLWIHAGYL